MKLIFILLGIILASMSTFFLTKSKKSLDEIIGIVLLMISVSFFAIGVGII